MYWIQKRLLSQNFLCNRQLVKQLIRDSSIGKNDTVLEIGAGKGIITQELLEVSKQALAIAQPPSRYLPRGSKRSSQ